MREDDPSVLRQFVGAMRPHILDAYRRGVAYGYDPPVVSVKVYGDFDEPGVHDVSIKALDAGQPWQFSPTARSDAGLAFRVVHELLDVPEGYFRVVVSDSTEVVAMMARRISDGA